MTQAEALDAAIKAAGTIAELARHLGVTRSAICQWKRVPADRVLEVEALTGISRHLLRDDVFGKAPQEAA